MGRKRKEMKPGKKKLGSEVILCCDQKMCVTRFRKKPKQVWGGQKVYKDPKGT